MSYTNTKSKLLPSNIINIDDDDEIDVNSDHTEIKKSKFQKISENHWINDNSISATEFLGLFNTEQKTNKEILISEDVYEEKENISKRISSKLISQNTDLGSSKQTEYLFGFPVPTKYLNPNDFPLIWIFIKESIGIPIGNLSPSLSEVALKSAIRNFLSKLSEYEKIISSKKEVRIGLKYQVSDLPEILTIPCPPPKWTLISKAEK